MTALRVDDEMTLSPLVISSWAGAPASHFVINLAEGFLLAANGCRATSKRRRPETNHP